VFGPEDYFGARKGSPPPHARSAKGLLDALPACDLVAVVEAAVRLPGPAEVTNLQPCPRAAGDSMGTVGTGRFAVSVKVCHAHAEPSRAL
jgi:hypothetical protein